MLNIVEFMHFEYIRYNYRITKMPLRTLKIKNDRNPHVLIFLRQTDVSIVNFGIRMKKNNYFVRDFRGSSNV